MLQFLERYAANEVLPHAGMGPCVKGHGEVWGSQ